MVIVRDNSSIHKKLGYSLPIILIMIFVLGLYFPFSDMLGVILTIIIAIYILIVYYFLLKVPRWKEDGNIIFKNSSLNIDCYNQQKHIIYEDIESVSIDISGYHLYAWKLVFDYRPNNQIVLKYKKNIFTENFLMKDKKDFIKLIDEIKLLSDLNIDISINVQDSILSKDDKRRILKYQKTRSR